MNKANKLQDQNKKIQDFAELLENLDIEEKKRSLWHTIFVQAMDDREKAQVLYDNILESIVNEPANHALLGTVAAKYLERSEKSNSQILELAKLIQKSEEEHGKFDADSILDQINSK